ncbi:MAG: Asp-tRNA(Asn)/Glu-tRNA(Gln) amidotransferase subunit GatA, partial [Paracoccaceae bacterium]
MAELNKLTLSEARDLLRKKELTSLELTQSCLTAIEEGSKLNAFVHGTADIALERARAADVRLAGGDARDMCGL